MITKIKRNMKKEEILDLMSKHKKNKKNKSNWEIFCGILDLDENPNDIQKRLRNEWR